MTSHVRLTVRGTLRVGTFGPARPRPPSAPSRFCVPPHERQVDGAFGVHSSSPRAGLVVSSYPPNGNSVDRQQETVFTVGMTNTDLHSFTTNPSAPSLCDLITCHHDGCTASFFHILERGAGANYCLDHAAEIDREANGWTVWNSVD